MESRSFLKPSIYEIFEVAPPDNRASRFIQRFTVLLVGLNTLALILSFIHLLNPNHAIILNTVNFFKLDHTPLLRALEFLKTNRIYFFGAVETLSTACFAVGYLLRLWSASESPRFRGRLRYALRFFLLIDLVSVLPLIVVLFTPSREVTLQVLRLGWGIRHLKLLRYLRQRPVLEASRDELLTETEEQLAQVRQQVAKGREMDLARVNHSIEAVSRQCHQAAMQPRDRRDDRPSSSPLASRNGAAASPLLSLLDDLEADLTEPGQIEENAALIAAAYQQSADIFDQAPDRAMVDVALESDQAMGKKPVPLRRIGRTHFVPMASHYTEAFAKRNPMYVADVQRDLTRIRTAMAYALDQHGSQEGQIGINRAINQLRDLDSPVRLAWDDLLFQLEDEHQKRLQSVRTDIGRYGSLMFYIGRVWRWLLSRLAETRRLLETPKRLWALILQWWREGVDFSRRLLHPVLTRLGLVKPPTLELLRALDESRLESVLEIGLPADYLVHFEFAALQDEGLFLGLDQEFANINLAIERWQDQYQSSFIIYGHRGVGKSTLLNMARQRLFAEHLVIHNTITQKLAATQELAPYLAALLGCPEADRFEELADALLAGPPRAILLEDCHHLFFRRVGGLGAIRYLFWLIAKTNHHILWGISLDKSGYDFLNRTLPLSELFHVQIGLEERSGEELRRLMMMRHNRSGVGLHYVQDNRNEKALKRKIKALQKQRRSGRINQQEALELTYFDQLAATCAGNITVALFYWLRSIHVTDSDRYEVQPFDPLDLSLIWDLSQNEAFTLVAVLQHGTVTATELAKILDADEIDTRLELDILANHNILQIDFKTDTFEVNPVVLKAVCEMLQSRNLLQ